MALDDISEFNKVSLIWVPGHSGIPDNETADELARRGSETAFMGPQPALGVRAGLKTGLIKWRTRGSHQRFWERLDSCRQAKEFLSSYFLTAPTLH